MSKIRDKISETTGFYFRDISFHRCFSELEKGGQLDAKLVMKILATVCDYLEKVEGKKKKL